MPRNFTQRLSLFGRRAFVKRSQHPIHLPLRKISSQIATQPELGPRKVCAAVMPLVHFVRVVELAIVFRLPVFMVSRGMRIEIAYAEVWTTACLDRSRVDRPVRARRSMTYTDAEQSNNPEQCHSVHR